MSCSTLGTIPRIRPDTHLGIDGGGTKLSAFTRDADGAAVALRYSTSEYASFEAAYLQLVADLGYTPAIACSGLAGHKLAGGAVRLTNLKAWPAVDFNALAARTGTNFMDVGDLVAAYRGLELIDVSALPVFVLGWPRQGRKRLVLTVSTGINDATGAEPEDTVEAGHVGWQPVSDLEFDYLRFGLKDVGDHEIFTVEQAISGFTGWDRMYRFHVDRLGYHPALGLARDIMEARTRDDVPRTIEMYAKAGDPICQSIVELYAGILAGHIRNRVMATLATEVVLTGSVAVNIAPLISQNDRVFAAFTSRLIAAGGEHDDLAAETTIYLSGDALVPAMGAYELAKAA